MIKKILVPIDGSKTARKALEYAVDLAKQTGSPIILLSVIDKNPFYGTTEHGHKKRWKNNLI
jgi:nucleotide-binding universal stress UspA family protein